MRNMTERFLDKFSSFFCGKGLNNICLDLFWCFGYYFQILWRFLRRLRSFSSQKTPWGPIISQNKISKNNLKTCLRRAQLPGRPPEFTRNLIAFPPELVRNFPQGWVSLNFTGCFRTCTGSSRDVPGFLGLSRNSWTFQVPWVKLRAIP